MIFSLFLAFKTISRTLTVPNRRWGPSLEVPATEGVFRCSSYKSINLLSKVYGVILTFDGTNPIELYSTQIGVLTFLQCPKSVSLG